MASDATPPSRPSLRLGLHMPALWPPMDHPREGATPRLRLVQGYRVDEAGEAVRFKKGREMSAHTPGPWSLRCAADTMAKWWVNARSVRTASENVQPHGLFVAQVGAGHGDKLEVEANARLIAAAPELLQAARRMVELLDQGPDMRAPVFFRELWREREVLRAALTKAQGS